MSDKKGLRFDKYLWSVRLFKTRSMATDACKSGKILVNGQTIKPSKIAEIDVSFTLRKAPALLTYKILSMPPSRISAKLADQYLEDLTPQSEKDKLDYKLTPPVGQRLRGTGRPTKKDRRTLDDIQNREF